MSTRVKISTEAISIAIDNLEAKNLKNGLKAALRRCLSPIRKAAINNYKASFPGSQKWRGIFLSYDRDGLGGSVAIVPRKKGARQKAIEEEYKTWVLPIIERGTNVRKTEKGYNRGIMPKKPFFVPAKAAMPNVAQTFAEELKKEFEKRMNNQ